MRREEQGNQSFCDADKSNPRRSCRNMNTEPEPEQEPDPDHDPEQFEALRFELLTRHSDRLGQLYDATRTATDLEKQAIRHGSERTRETAANLGRLLIRRIRAEHAHATDVLFGVADETDDARHAALFRGIDRDVEQLEAFVLELADDPADEKGD